MIPSSESKIFESSKFGLFLLWLSFWMLVRPAGFAEDVRSYLEMTELSESCRSVEFLIPKGASSPFCLFIFRD